MSAAGSTRRTFDWRSRVQSLRNIPPLLRLVWSSSPKTVVALLTLRLIVAGIPVAALAVTKRIIDAIVAHVSTGSTLVPQFWSLVALEFGLATSAAALNRAVDFCDATLADRFTLAVSVRIMHHASRLDLACYEDPTFYDKLERARVQATDRIGTFQAIGRLMQEMITAVTLICTILVYSPILILVLLCTVIPAFIGDCRFAMDGYVLAFQQTRLRRELDYVRLLGASKETAKELKLFGLSQYWTALYETLSKTLHEQNLNLTRRRLVAGCALSLLTIAGYYAAYAAVIYQTLIGKFSIGSLTLLAGAIAGTSTKIQTIFSTIASVSDQLIFVKDLFDMFAIQPQVRSKTPSIKVPGRLRQGFEFRHVSFAYPGTHHFVLRDLTFCVSANERIALVGSNGGGKTTIVKLMTRLYDPSAGEILLGGMDLREYDLEDLHRQIAVVFQDFVKYDRTVYENISIGNLHDAGDAGMAVAAAQKSSAHSFIMKLPLGYEQMLGRRFDHGIDLSGGEWQRLALARAYSRKAQILVLDEPTASLDPRSERDLFDRFSELTRGKMALLISHRFSTVRMADRILVLEGGSVVEEGSHSELLAQGNRYSELFTLQASNYS